MKAIPTAVNVDTTVPVNFGVTFTTDISVITSCNTANPAKVLSSAKNVTRSGFDAVLNRSTLVETVIYWIAIGR